MKNFFSIRPLKPFYFLTIALSVFLSGCSEPPAQAPASNVLEFAGLPMKGALLGTRFKSMEDLQVLVTIEYIKIPQSADHAKSWIPAVRLTNSSSEKSVTSLLTTGVSEKDFIKARDGSFWDRALLASNSPYFVINRSDLLRVFILSRRRFPLFGEGDVAFYDLAETMSCHIHEKDLKRMTDEDLSEKGFINTFNHITAQAFMTTLFSEELADFVADSHERSRLPELVSGDFTQEQLLDLDNGPVDNYVDMINNEWGQELGKELQRKFKVHRKTFWSPMLLANYLNHIQQHLSKAFQIEMEPYQPTDEVVIRFSIKINRIMSNVSGLSDYK